MIPRTLVAGFICAIVLAFVVVPFPHNNIDAPAPAPEGINVNVWAEGHPEYTEVPSTVTDLAFLVSVVGAPTDDTKARNPLALSLVVDTSGSMGGDRMDLVKASLDFIARHVTDRDHVGLVGYSGDVSLYLPMTRMDVDGRLRFQDAIKRLVANGGTNLCGGLLAGFDVLRGIDIVPLLDSYGPSKRRWSAVPTLPLPTDTVAAVWLLTDGHQNVGRTNPADIERLLRERISRFLPRATVHTFGYGADHDGTLLGALARASEGSYYYVKNVGDVKELFADCLGGMTSVVATDVVVDIASPFTVTKVMSTHGTTLPMRFKEIYAEERRDFLVTLRLPPATVGSSTTLGDIVVTFKGTAAVRYPIGSVTRVAGNAPVGAPDPECVTERVRLDVAAALAEAEVHHRQGRDAEARTVLVDCQSRVGNATGANATKTAYFGQLLNMSTSSEGNSTDKNMLANTTNELLSQRGSSSGSLYSNSKKDASRATAMAESASP